MPLLKLKKAKINFSLNPLKRTLTTAELINFLDGSNYLIAGTERITREVFRQCPHLEFISRCGSGIDNIDLKAAEQYNVSISSTPEAPVGAVAELTLAFILNTLRNINSADRMLREGKWQKPMGNLLFGKKIGILGFGRVGRRLAHLLQPFEVQFLIHEIMPPKIVKGLKNLQFLSLREVCKQADILTIHLPYSFKVHHLINQRTLSLMKKDLILINTSRGEIVDEQALADALSQKKIKAAALDVFEQEPYSGPLTQFENVLLTPHLGAYTKETRVAMELKVVENVLDYLQRRPAND